MAEVLQAPTGGDNKDMRVTVFSCGPAANESELTAFKHLESRLQSMAGDDEWILLTNLAFSVTHQLQSDEIDVVVIGPPGVRVIEVKHWTSQWVDANGDLVAQEADRVTNKARKIGTTLRKIVPELPRVDGAILLTQESSRVKRLGGREVRGVRFYLLSEWKQAVGLDPSTALSPPQVIILGRTLEPKTAVALDGSLRRLAGYVNLELQTPKEERFHAPTRGAIPQDGIGLSCICTMSPEAMKRTRRQRRAENTTRFTPCNSILGRRAFLTPIKTRLDTRARCSSSRW